MAIFIFHPANHADRRADGIGFVLAEGADEAAARASAGAMIGAPGIDGWSAVPVSAGIDPVAVQGLPVGKPGNATWPDRTRADRALNA
ncbi:hypothetical protein QQS45_03170 [Alteriqipengyuania flavescens]|uniref:hypothetical protein n=1 Tax=Alteriqipengyuania flavescens TaxID=3053610 RepID=UPI0025B5E976|nr:hypothetical protein [Alteriqipengyuania flavescens]WJY19249.1 hypothetical protein QQW98_03165 [Alteriqipengyuania flavescens]WJY25190.1 hypothetical protein QQS45_03170 [Alteriqipengyuania flavescens]